MRLETERLIIRDWNLKSRGDVMGAFAMYSDPEVLRYFPTTRPVASMKEMREVLRQRLEQNDTFPPGQGVWAVEEKSTRRIVGTALLKPMLDNAGKLTNDIEVGWHLRRDAWGKGYATEFGRELLRYGFEDLQIDPLYAFVLPENLPSIRVTQRLGMTPLGPTEKYYGVRAELFRITREQWRSSAGKRAGS
ncbi:MAG: GNAT family N-acetyltransferase [Phycisphaerae bacterium]|nr:GNAT family N-acetyltransferase [Phycisphaerae bacterium]MDW8262919.1 GNAT family N-acetyltransferase [Phycisphaerales bacterium]